MSVCLLTHLISQCWYIHWYLTTFWGNAVDLIKQTFDSPTMPDSKVYYACFSPTTEKYPQREKCSAYILTISLSWKLQRHSPNTTLLRLQWMNLEHTQEFFCFVYSWKGKKKNSHRKTEWKTHIDSSYPETPLWDLSMFQPETSTISVSVLQPRIGNMVNSNSKQ